MKPLGHGDDIWRRWYIPLQETAARTSDDVSHRGLGSVRYQLEMPGIPALHQLKWLNPLENINHFNRIRGLGRDGHGGVLGDFVEKNKLLPGRWRG